MTLSCQGDQYSRLDTFNVKIHPLFQILWVEPGWCNNSGEEEEVEEEEEEEEEGAQCYVLELGL